MALIRSTLLAVLVVLLAVPASAAPVSRPFTGIGLAALRPGPLTDATVALYREPGVGRITTLTRSKLPSLSFVLAPNPDEIVATVADKRGAWIEITYDAAGRKGWILMERSWRYLSWKEYLKGRPVRLLPGLRSTFYLLHQQPSDEAKGESVAGQELRVIDVRDDWCMVVSPSAFSGWLRWRDPDGRFLVSIGTVFGKQK